MGFSQTILLKTTTNNYKFFKVSKLLLYKPMVYLQKEENYGNAYPYNCFICFGYSMFYICSEQNGF